VVANTLQQELASACDSHLYQLDMRYETMQELQGLLLCQVLFSSYHLYGEPFWRLMHLLFVLLAHDRNVWEKTSRSVWLQSLRRGMDK